MNLSAYVPPAWDELIDREALARVERFLDEEDRSGRPWHPRAERVFHALSFFDPQHARVVILGQDPYPRAGDPTGLAFSLDRTRIAPSARNILTELADDLGSAQAPGAGADLRPWARQGVLLWNTTPTTRIGHAGAHTASGWGQLSALMLQRLDRLCPRAVWICWGAHARAIACRVMGEDTPQRLIHSNHPSPLAARRGALPFIGSRPFTRANALLEEAGLAPIDWRLGGEGP